MPAIDHTFPQPIGFQLPGFVPQRSLPRLSPGGKRQSAARMAPALKNPITGMGSCARATHGHAAEPPMILMKSRRRIAAPTTENELSYRLKLDP
jgi:hypothetical protein